MEEILNKPVCVLLDTNTWRENLLLRTALGSALLYTINRQNVKIALPEVVEQEIKKHSMEAAKEAISNIEKSFNYVRLIMGFHSPYKIPNDEEIASAIDKRLDELEKFIIRIPFTLDHAKASLLRVNENCPPSSTKKQQYKDCAIWEAALSVGKAYHVYLISNDGDFYQNKERTDLNKILSEECCKLGVNITIYKNLNEFLKNLSQMTPSIDKQSIAENIFKTFSADIAKDAARHDLKLLSLKKFDIKAFLTENPDNIAVEYCIYIDSIDTAGDIDQPKRDPEIIASGGCRYDITYNAILDNYFDSIEFKWTDTNGQIKNPKSIFLRTKSLFIGKGPNIPFSTMKIIE
jgi:rRNA-processing protein FCF1